MVQHPAPVTADAGDGGSLRPFSSRDPCRLPRAVVLAVFADRRNRQGYRTQLAIFGVALVAILSVTVFQTSTILDALAKLLHQ